VDDRDGSDRKRGSDGAAAAGPRGRVAGRIAFKAREAREFLGRTIWVHHRRGERSLRAALYSMLRVVVLVVRGFLDHDLTTRAAALTYSSLLALVPTLAVAFSIFQAFKGLDRAHEQLQQVLYANLLPIEERRLPPPGETLSPEDAARRQQLAEVRHEVEQRIQSAIESVREGVQENALLATIVLFLTVILMLARMEETFNALWGVQKSRTVFQRFTTYWAVATLGPVLFGGSIAMTTSLRSTYVIRWLESTIPILEFAYKLAPIAITGLGFTVVYVFMPHTKVKFRAALAGGLVAAILFELGKHGFTFGSAFLLGTYNKVYGSIASLFIFLFWIFFCWMIVLIGVEVCVAAQSASTRAMEVLASKPSRRVEDLIGLRLAVEVGRGFHFGEPPPSAEAIAATLDVPLRLVREGAAAIEEAGIIREITIARDLSGFVPGRPLEKITVCDVLRALGERPGAAAVAVASDDGTRYVEGLLGKADQALERVLATEDLRAIVERLQAARVAAAAAAAAASPEPEAAPGPQDGEGDGRKVAPAPP